ncbi:hypothetical protein FD755_000185 [Muntiacus reevesi]|uniref:Adenosine deaminase domain-containing protein n=1 Tax=Muntiacus reevesi TaxID=9886 RepID=A0A5J5N0L9_MUNRE|nr:hypothetical protein FD755_000185 [Muntiacus reevesi]
MMEAEDKQPWKTIFPFELPKMELHFHLSGSISSNAMRKLIHNKPGLKIHHSMTMINKGKKRTLEEYLQKFQSIHQLATSPEQTFMKRKYYGMTEKTYVEFVLDTIKQYLTAINKRGGPSVAKETVKLPEEFFLATKDTVLGLDLGGDPMGRERRGRKKETFVFLDLPPDRIRHGTFLSFSEGRSLDPVNFVRHP